MFMLLFLLLTVITTTLDVFFDKTKNKTVYNLAQKKKHYFKHAHKDN